MANGQCTQEHTPKSCIIVLYHYLFFSTHQDGMAVATHTHTHTHTHRAWCTHAQLTLVWSRQSCRYFHHRGFHVCVFVVRMRAQWRGKCGWGGEEGLRMERRGRGDVCLNLDVLSCQKNTSRLKQTKKNPRILHRSLLLHPHRSSSILSSCTGALLLCRLQQVSRWISKTNLLHCLSFSMSYY